MSTYCVEADMNKVYGTDNIAEWSNIDGDSSDAEKTARITEAIAQSSEEVDDVLRLIGARIPAVTHAGGSTPQTIKHLTAVLAGLWLYEAAGAQDYNRSGTIRHGHAWRREWVDDYLDKIATGKRKLDLTMGN